MLLTPRTYNLAQTADRGRTRPQPGYFLCTQSKRERDAEEKRLRRMLLLHQTGGVKVGEVIRYTVTYTPSEDRILPSPAFLHVRIRNTSAIPLRAAYLHGPYTIHVAAYPSTFNPNNKNDEPKTYGYPEFEPNVKAGGYWNARLTVPEHIRSSAGSTGRESEKSATWVIEIASQIIFSNSATVNYELLIARDERSLDLGGFTATTGNSHGVPGKVQDHQQGQGRHNHPSQPKGVYSKAIRLVVDDTTSLWNKPELPEWDEEKEKQNDRRRSKDTNKSDTPRKQKKIHLVIVTHGLHSNLGADLLYLKESIDGAAKQARENRRARRQENSEGNGPKQPVKETSTAALSGGQEDIPVGEDEDEEEVIVRGFDGNVIRTERGIQYLGKRLAKHVLKITYPDQPFLPVKKSMSKKITKPFSSGKSDESIPAHEGSSIQYPIPPEPKRAYKFTSISFIGHSLGGLVQTYAIAYIHKHSPQFFENIKPINFITMASPMLGLSNENPMYVKFALDFGLVGRTGQDLGLTWRAPTLVRSGWTAMVSGFGTQSQDQEESADPGAKPLLRILPTGPAHLVLRQFRNRTVYSNVVNDGIVPLRTSCLLFLDWRGIGRVDKARRENGLIGNVAVWGLGQLSWQNRSPNHSRLGLSDDEGDGADTPDYNGEDSTVPLPDADSVTRDDEAQQAAAEPSAHQFLDGQERDSDGKPVGNDYFQPQNTLMQLWSYIRPKGKHTERDKKMFKRSQTIYKDDEELNAAIEASTSKDNQKKKRPMATRGDSIVDNPESMLAPPKTTIFESAGDLINPPVPSSAWINDPSTRARTIFHDRIYHPEDIPPPPRKKSSSRSFSSSDGASQSSDPPVEEGGMRVEEKIARAYHRDLSWRKVLVRLEPDAHNNMIVRRMFGNAYGWPVIKHLCDTHFADTYSAATRDEDEPAIDRAAGLDKPVKEDGEHVKGQEDLNPPIERTDSELREVADELTPLKTSGPKFPKRVNTSDSMLSINSGDWDRIYSDETSEDEDDLDGRNAIQRFLQFPSSPRSPRSPLSPNRPTSSDPLRTPDGQGTSEAEISDFLTKAAPVPVPALDVHRGLGIRTARLRASSSQEEPDAAQALGGAPQILEQGKQVMSPTETPNISEIGFRKSLDSSAVPEADRARRSSVTEQVASIVLKGDGAQEQGG